MRLRQIGMQPNGRSKMVFGHRDSIDVEIGISDAQMRLGMCSIKRQSFVQRGNRRLRLRQRSQGSAAREPRLGKIGRGCNRLICIIEGGGALTVPEQHERSLDKGEERILVARTSRQGLLQQRRCFGGAAA